LHKDTCGSARFHSRTRRSSEPVRQRCCGEIFGNATHVTHRLCRCKHRVDRCSTDPSRLSPSVRSVPSPHPKARVRPSDVTSSAYTNGGFTIVDPPLPADPHNPSPSAVPERMHVVFARPPRRPPTATGAVIGYSTGDWLCFFRPASSMCNIAFMSKPAVKSWPWNSGTGDRQRTEEAREACDVAKRVTRCRPRPLCAYT
jgi:hypothetical protein